jgi:hypothetical protein
LGFKIRGAKKSARTAHTRHITMQVNMIRGDVQFLLQASNKCRQLPHLIIGEWPSISIANQANSHGVSIQIIG